MEPASADPSSPVGTLSSAGRPLIVPPASVINCAGVGSCPSSFVFDDGYDHTVVTPADETGKKGPRVVLAVGISHPDIVTAYDAEGLKAMAETERSNWQEGSTNERVEL